MIGEFSPHWRGGLTAILSRMQKSSVYSASTRPDRGRGFEAAIGWALRGIAVSREFPLRIERDPTNVAADSP